MYQVRRIDSDGNARGKKWKIVDETGSDYTIFIQEDKYYRGGNVTPIYHRKFHAEFECAKLKFTDAFEALDRQAGDHNFVSLVDLRKALPECPRDSFDKLLRWLRREQRYTLSSAQSKHGITAEEREAGIEEAGSFLLHVSRRTY